MSMINLRKDLEKIKSLNKWSNRLILLGLAIWILETLGFMLAYGFHLTPYNSTEKLLDTISSTIIMLGIGVMISASGKASRLLVKMIEYDTKLD